LFWGPLVGPIVAMLSFVCSIGNVPLAAVLWNGGINFGGVISFIFADLIVLPILNIYRKYYRGRMALFLLATSYTAMVIAGLTIELVFKAIGLVPRERAAVVVEPHVTLNYTTVLNVIFLGIAGVLLVRFFKTNGLAMLRMMNVPRSHASRADHRHHTALGAAANVTRSTQASGSLTPRARAVVGPTSPSITSLREAWKDTTAAWVLGPKSPSMGPGSNPFSFSFCWISRTVGPIMRGSVSRYITTLGFSISWSPARSEYSISGTRMPISHRRPESVEAMTPALAE